MLSFCNLQSSIGNLRAAPVAPEPCFGRAALWLLWRGRNMIIGAEAKLEDQGRGSRSAGGRLLGGSAGHSGLRHARRDVRRAAPEPLRSRRGLSGGFSLLTSVRRSPDGPMNRWLLPAPSPRCLHSSFSIQNSSFPLSPVPYPLLCCSSLSTCHCSLPFSPCFALRVDVQMYIGTVMRR